MPNTTLIASLLCTLLLCCCAVAQDDSKPQSKSNESTKTEKSKPPSEQPNYNEKLAKKLGADEYGMKSYVFVVLKTGKAKIEDEEKRNEAFRGHFANMAKLAKEKKLALAGPFIEGGEKRGLFILNVATIKEAEAIVKTDPAVKAGIFDFELTKLYSSAALMRVNDIHGKIQKTKIE